MKLLFRVQADPFHLYRSAGGKTGTAQTKVRIIHMLGSVLLHTKTKLFNSFSRKWW